MQRLLLSCLCFSFYLSSSLNTALKKSTNTSTQRHPKQHLTPAVAIHLLVANATETAAQWHQPVSIRTAVQFGCVPLLRVLHTHTPHFHQRGRVHMRHCVRKSRQVPYCRWAAFVEHLMWKNGKLKVLPVLRKEYNWQDHGCCSCRHKSHPAGHWPWRTQGRCKLPHPERPGRSP